MQLSQFQYLHKLCMTKVQIHIIVTSQSKKCKPNTSFLDPCSFNSIRLYSWEIHLFSYLCQVFGQTQILTLATTKCLIPLEQFSVVYFHFRTKWSKLILIVTIHSQFKPLLVTKVKWDLSLKLILQAIQLQLFPLTALNLMATLAQWHLSTLILTLT